MLKKINRFFIVVIALVCMGLVAGCTQTEEAEKPKTSGLEMKVANSFWPGAFWKDIAEKKGWFKEAGLNLTMVRSDDDYYGSLADMIAGKMDGNSFPLFDYILAVGDGSDTVAVMAPDTSTGIDAIVAKAGIENIQDLKGKRVGLAKNTYSEYLLEVVLEREGLKSEDVILVEALSENATELLLQDKVDAIITWEPITSQAIAKTGGKKLFDSSEIPKLTFSVDVFHRSFIEQRPEDLQAYINVWHKTSLFIQQKPKEAFNLIGERYNLTLEDVEAYAELDKILNLQENIAAFSFATGQESLHGSTRSMIKFMKKRNLLKNPVDSTRIFDAQFIRKLE